MTAITDHVNVDTFDDQTMREFPVKAATRIYRGSFVGGHQVTKLAQPFVPTNIFLGIAHEEANNTDGTAGQNGGNPVYATDSATKGRINVITQADVVCTLTGASADDLGKAVYAQDSSNTVALTGHPDAFVGRIVHVDTDGDGDYSTTTVVVRLRAWGEKPGIGDAGSMEVGFGQENFPVITGDASGSGAQGGLFYSSILGLGWTREAESTQAEIDATSEASNHTIETGLLFDTDKGVTFKARLVVSAASGSTVDADWGLINAVSAAIRADMDAAGLTNHALFHLDGGDDNIDCQSDDNSTDTGLVDSTIDNDTSGDTTKEFDIIVLTDGSVEFWINGSQVLTGTTFNIGTGIAVGGVINIEKTTGTATAELRVTQLRVAGCPAVAA